MEMYNYLNGIILGFVLKDLLKYFRKRVEIRKLKREIREQNEKVAQGIHGHYDLIITGPKGREPKELKAYYTFFYCSVGNKKLINYSN
jgi:hypothetical protein